MFDRLKGRALTLMLTLLVMVTFSPLVGVAGRTESGHVEPEAYPYPTVSISGDGTLTSNVSGVSVRVSFVLEGVFWIESEKITIPLLNASGQATLYNVTGTFTVEGEVHEVVGLFSNVTFGYPTLSGQFFAINVGELDTQILVFIAVAPRMLLRETLPTRPWHNFWVKYTGFLAAGLVDPDYPWDFFLTKPPRFLSVTVEFPK